LLAAAGGQDITSTSTTVQEQKLQKLAATINEWRGGYMEDNIQEAHKKLNVVPWDTIWAVLAQGPISRVVSGYRSTRNSTVATGLTTPNPQPLEMGWFYYQIPGSSYSQFWLHLRI